MWVYGRTGKSVPMIKENLLRNVADSQVSLFFFQQKFDSVPTKVISLSSASWTSQNISDCPNLIETRSCESGSKSCLRKKNFFKKLDFFFKFWFIKKKTVDYAWQVSEWSKCFIPDNNRRSDCGQGVQVIYSI